MGDGSTQNSGQNSGQRGRPQNLIPWKKGQSGNPGGRPKRKPITDAYRRLLELEDKDGVTAAEHIARAIIMKAIAGEVVAAREITDRVEGSIKQAVEFLFGDMTDEQLAEFIAAQYGNAGSGDAGSPTPGDEPGAGGEPSSGEAGEQNGTEERPNVDTTTGTADDGIPQ